MSRDRPRRRRASLWVAVYVALFGPGEETDGANGSGGSGDSAADRASGRSESGDHE